MVALWLFLELGRVPIGIMVHTTLLLEFDLEGRVGGSFSHFDVFSFVKVGEEGEGTGVLGGFVEDGHHLLTIVTSDAGGVSQFIDRTPFLTLFSDFCELSIFHVLDV